MPISDAVRPNAVFFSFSFYLSVFNVRSQQQQLHKNRIQVQLQIVLCAIISCDFFVFPSRQCIEMIFFVCFCFRYVIDSWLIGCLWYASSSSTNFGCFAIFSLLPRCYQFLVLKTFLFGWLIFNRCLYKNSTSM